MSDIFLSPVNPHVRKTKYQHLLTAIYRRLAGATARQDGSLIAQLNAELAQIQAEIRRIL